MDWRLRRPCSPPLWGVTSYALLVRFEAGRQTHGWSESRSRFITFELETLTATGAKVLIPVLLYLFHRIDQRLDGKPTLVVIVEAWIMLANELFGAKIEEWLRTLRKKNAAVILATQSLTEVANSPFCDVILESCPTKIYLPNPEARNPNTAALYHRFGLSPRQREIIADAIPKRHYYYVSPLGRRLFDLALEPATLSFVGVGSKEDIFKARRMMREYGDDWPVEWLRVATSQNGPSI
jgi:type IV secretion system protein TrbE